MKEKRKIDSSWGGAFGLGKICYKSSRGVCIVRLSIGKPMGTRYRIAKIRKGIPRAFSEQSCSCYLRTANQRSRAHRSAAVLGRRMGQCHMQRPSLRGTD